MALAVCLRQRSLSFHLRLDAENHLVEHLRGKVVRRKGRERVHIDCLLSFERELNVLRWLFRWLERTDEQVRTVLDDYDAAAFGH